MTLYWDREFYFSHEISGQDHELTQMLKLVRISQHTQKSHKGDLWLITCSVVREVLCGPEFVSCAHSSSEQHGLQH